MHAPRRCVGLAGLVGTVLALASLPAASAQTSQPAAEQAQLLRTHSRVPYVHRLTLYDADGKAINPAEKDAPPYSPRATCGKCHEYGLISQGWHFNAASAAPASASAEDVHGRRGEPWIWTDPATGTALPLSYRGWPGTFRPEDVGITSRQFLARFGAFLPGGGIAESPRLESRGSEAAAKGSDARRWEISGPLEIDCMTCHAATAGWDLNEWARQIEAENYRWAPTAALGLGVIRGEAKRLPDDYDPFDPASAGRPDQQPPRVEYRKPLFDADDRVFFDVVRTPPDAACLQCHSTREVGAGAPQRWQHTPDVHTAAGIRCADCHRNDIHHHTIRGYPGEPQQPPAAAALSCRGCHLGVPGAEDESVALGGHFGAPHPQHAGLPAVHFEVLTCTACHSGPWPEMSPREVQTSMAHGLGISTKERRDNQLPHLVAPLFERFADGDAIEPVRALWFSYWAGVGLKPLPLAMVQAAAKKVLARANSKHGEVGPLSREDIAAMLGQLREQQRSDQIIVYLRGLQFFQLGSDGKLNVGTLPALVTWPLSHEVRPASQSLGARGCADCHSSNSPLVMADTYTRAVTDVVTPWHMHAENQLDPELAKLWAPMFAGREAFKWLGWVCLGLASIGLFGLIVGGLMIGPGIEAAPAGSSRKWFVAVGLVLLALDITGLSLTGIAMWLRSNGTAGWKLWAHMALSPLFLAGLVWLALAWARQHRRGAGASPGMWLLRTVFVLLGWITIASILVLMLPIFGSAQEPSFVAAHRIAGLALVVVGLALVVYPRVRRRTASPKG